MKRSIFSSTAIVLMLTSLLMSCGDSANTPAVTDAPENMQTEIASETVDDGRLPAPAVIDMNGAELRILNSTPESFNWATTTILVEEADGDILNDALFNREREVEDQYNCSIIEIPEDRTDH